MNIKNISDDDLAYRFNKLRSSQAFGVEFISLSAETKIRAAEKLQADVYRHEFDALGDRTILNCMMSFSGDNFKTLTELAESQAKKFVDEQVF